MLKAFTEDPKELLTKFLKSIADGKIKTWRVNDQGYFTRVATVPLGTNRSWFRARAGENALRFNIIRSKGSNVSKQSYASYHARLAETLLAHFDSEIDKVEITALASSGDIV